MTSETQQTNMYDYRPLQGANSSGWVPFDASANGATKFDGDPQCEVRIDLAVGKVMAGEYRQKAASFDIHWSFTEHSFVLDGEVTITDLNTEKTVTYRSGDGWMIKAGSHTRWEVRKDGFRKSFFLVTE